MEALFLIGKLKVDKSKNEPLYVKVVGGLIEACFDAAATQLDARDVLKDFIGDDKDVKKQVQVEPKI